MRPNNVRVYGVLLRAGQVLMSAEKIMGRDVLKFPGGAVEADETPEAALVREFLEEGNLAVTPAYLLHVPGTLFSPWTHSEYTPIYYRVWGEGAPRTPDHETVELIFMGPKQAIESGRMAAPEILALNRALRGGDATSRRGKLR
ncbi:MAG: NUDIX hydrolase [Alphaproteobacteria bacterium]